MAGIRPASFGYKTWVVEPAYAGFGLDEVNATVPTPHGPLRVAWSVKDHAVSVSIDSPANTTGKLVLSKDWACGQESVPRNCEKTTDFIREIRGGKTENFVPQMAI